MLVRHIKLVAAMAILVTSMATAAGAVVLWDQSNWNTAGEGSLNLSSTSCNQISGNTKLHTANDVTFASAVTITTVRIYESLGNVQTATLAYLWIAPKTGSTPTQSSSDVNNDVNLVPITVATETIGPNTVAVVTASGLNINLPAGDYWVSLTPRHSRGVFPYTVHLVTSTAVVGDPTTSILACTVNSDWLQVLPTPYDYAIKIEGDGPVAVQPSMWSKVKSIYR